MELRWRALPAGSAIQVGRGEVPNKCQGHFATLIQPEFGSHVRFSDFRSPSVFGQLMTSTLIIISD